MGQEYGTTVLEQNTDTIHDQLSLAGTALPSLTGSNRHEVPMATTKLEYSSNMPNLLCTRVHRLL